MVCCQDYIEYMSTVGVQGAGHQVFCKIWVDYFTEGVICKDFNLYASEYFWILIGESDIRNMFLLDIVLGFGLVLAGPEGAPAAAPAAWANEQPVWLSLASYWLAALCLCDV